MNVDYVKFRGLRHYPVGNATLLKRDNALIVSELTNAMDGIAIDTGYASDVCVRFIPLEIKSDTVIGITFHATDNKQRLRSIGQWAITQSEQLNVSNLLLNTKLEGQYIELTGRKAHRKLFRNHIKPEGYANTNWLLVGSFDLAQSKTWLSDIDCSIEVRRNEEGKIVQITTTKVIGSKGLISPACNKNIGLSFSKNQNGYNVDELQISSTANYPEGLPYDWESYITQVMITGQDVSMLTLEHTEAF